MTWKFGDVVVAIDKGSGAFVISAMVIAEEHTSATTHHALILRDDTATFSSDWTGSVRYIDEDSWELLVDGS